MASLQASINITAPIFAMMLAGWIICRLNIINQTTLDHINGFNSKIILPILLFYNTYTTNLKQVFNLRLLLFSTVSIVFFFLLSHKITGFIEKVPERRSVTAISVFRSNYLIYGLVIAKNLCGEENLGPVAMLAALIVPLLQLLCVILLEIGHEGKTDISVLILNFIKNPILLASAAGFALQALPKMPVQVQDALHDISQCATPLSFIVLGGMFSIDAIKKNINNLIYGITGKLIVVPAIMLPIAYQFGFRGPELIALVSLFTAPVAINVFNFAKAMNADVELAGQFVVLSSLFSIATVFFWIFFLNQFNMI